MSYNKWYPRPNTKSKGAKVIGRIPDDYYKEHKETVDEYKKKYREEHKCQKKAQTAQN
jgi:hypothetical protein